MELLSKNYLLLAPVLLLLLVALVALLLAFKWRVVVGTNVVHIVQTRKLTVSYGSALEAGNVYYAIPSYIPIFGLSRTILPVNNFALDLNNYRAYDKDRVPFEIHVTAFFRVNDTNIAAKRVQDFNQLMLQLDQIVKGAVRKILASHDVHTVMTARATFGTQFTDEVRDELKSWGVEPVKNLELMDIRDTDGSSVLANIMARKSSHIEMESRAEVALNKQKAETAEIEARRAIELSRIEAERTTKLASVEQAQAIGERSAQQQQAIGIAQEKASQEVKTQGAVTAEREMQIVSVRTQRQAQIQKDAALVAAAQAQEVAVVAAEQARKVTVIQSTARLDQAKIDSAAAIVAAEQNKQVLVTASQADLEKAKLQASSTASLAEGMLEKTKREAEGTVLTGEARAGAEKALLLAPVEAQVRLATEIGSNAAYQSYLVTIRQIEAAQAVGIVQADALKQAEIKIFANTGDAPSGIASLGDLLGSKGGQKLGAFLSSLKESSPPTTPPMPISPNGKDNA